MGTRYEDQPPELWAEPASLDPTPVWKQFVLVGALLALMLALLGVVAVVALAAELATPPALVPGDRLVLSRADLPGVMGAPLRIAGPLVREDRAFWILQAADGEYVAVSAFWSHPDTGASCPVSAGKMTPGPAGAVWKADAPCDGRQWNFGPRGEPINAPRGLDRYLVSVSDDRIVVNLSRTIRGFGKTPQPRVSPLPEATPTPARTR